MEATHSVSAGADAGSAGGWGEREHFVHFYAEETALLEALNGYVRRSLVGDAAAVVIATREHLEALDLWLASQGLDLQQLRERGQYVALDALQALPRLLVNGWPDPALFAEIIGPVIEAAVRRHGRVAAFGEMVSLLFGERRFGEAVQLERLWTDLARRHGFSLFCAYRMPPDAAVPPEVLSRVCLEHERVVPAALAEGLASEPHFSAAIREQADRARALLAAIVESSDDAIVSKTLDGEVSSWNGGAMRIFGYSAEEMVGRPITTIIPADLQYEEAIILAKLRRGERIEHFETIRLTKDGRRIPVSLTVSPVRDSSGRIIGVSKVARDTSERKQSEERLRDADRRKDEFLAMLGHELRNPLAPVRNVIEVLRRGPLDAVQSEMCSILDRQVQHMTRLLDDLLDVSRITHGRIKFQEEPLDVLSVVVRAVENSRPLIDARHHRLDLLLPREPVFTLGDMTRLVQALSNLLNNAARYTPEGGSIVLTVKAVDRMVELSVRDNGSGIAAEVLPHVFELFVQADRPLERSQGGLGLGLTLVRRIVEHHQGQVEARSAGPSQGSEFIVRLPLLDVTTSASPPGAPAPALRAPDAPPRRILIIDDNRDASESMAIVLRLGGHEVVTAADGHAALEVVSSLEPHLVLLDIGLPGINGYELARLLRQRGCRATLAAVTGYGQPEDRQRSFEAGIEHHLVKPVDPATIGRLLV